MTKSHKSTINMKMKCVQYSELKIERVVFVSSITRHLRPIGLVMISLSRKARV